MKPGPQEQPAVVHAKSLEWEYRQGFGLRLRLRLGSWNQKSSFGRATVWLLPLNSTCSHHSDSRNSCFGCQILHARQSAISTSDQRLTIETAHTQRQRKREICRLVAQRTKFQWDKCLALDTLEYMEHGQKPGIFNHAQCRRC